MDRSTGPAKSVRGKTALIAVLKAPRDLEIAARDRWYRIPLGKAPKREFTHIAFYQPACFKPDGKRIVYCARVAGSTTGRRVDMLPGEPGHPAANQLYLKYSLGPLIKLHQAVLNNTGSRVCFGYATLRRLARAGNVLGLFNVFPIENMMCAALRNSGVSFHREHVIRRGGKIKYRLDFALFCRKGKLDIECDGQSGHSTPAQRAKDAQRDKWLKRQGWATLRFGGYEIVNNLKGGLREINTAIKKLGGLRDRANPRSL